MDYINKIREDKNILIYHLDYNYIYDKYKLLESKNYYININIINNICIFYLLLSISVNKKPLFNLNNIFNKDCKCSINEEQIDINIFIKLLYFINQYKNYNINIINNNNIIIESNKIYNNEISLIFENKKIVKIDINNKLLLNLHKICINKKIYDNYKLNLSYSFTDKYLKGASNNLLNYYNNLLTNYIKIYITEFYNSSKINEKYPDNIIYERNIYSIMYLFLYKYNKKYIDGFCKLFTKDTIIKLNNKYVITNDYLNLYKRLNESFTKYTFNINNIKIIDKFNAEVDYNFSGIYSNNKYYIDSNSKNIIPNNQNIITQNEIMNIKLNNNGHIVELFINNNTEYAGLELIYHQLLNTVDKPHNLITIEELIQNNKNISANDNKNISEDNNKNNKNIVIDISNNN